MSDKFAYTNPEFNCSPITTQPEFIPSPPGPAPLPMPANFDEDTANTCLDGLGCVGKCIANCFCDCFMEIVVKSCVECCVNAVCSC
ncbi:hypothetical protein CAEBREN_00706 [Caenorhabditis brenneri]|uniref:Uncharacterized protein n=1 Tax=Caenorhabditis brenneri TaxID=135651 RepID=G0NMW2_CAEBE|nr:hypothetical protein CAEBREN_00706 [Caenorhabditis brenneri]